MRDRGLDSPRRYQWRMFLFSSYRRRVRRHPHASFAQSAGRFATAGRRPGRTATRSVTWRRPGACFVGPLQKQRRGRAKKLRTRFLGTPRTSATPAAVPELRGTQGRPATTGARRSRRLRSWRIRGARPHRAVQTRFGVSTTLPLQRRVNESPALSSRVSSKGERLERRPERRHQADAAAVRVEPPFPPSLERCRRGPVLHIVSAPACRW